WVVRPLVLAFVGTLAACGSLWLTGWLLLDDQGNIGNFVLPFLPAGFAFLVAIGCAIVLLVRAAATLRGKENESHADRASDASRRLLRAGFRLAAAVVFA